MLFFRRKIFVKNYNKRIYNNLQQADISVRNILNEKIKHIVKYISKNDYNRNYVRNNISKTTLRDGVKDYRIERQSVVFRKRLEELLLNWVGGGYELPSAHGTLILTFKTDSEIFKSDNKNMICKIPCD